MNIGLLDIDGHNFPNLALMKLSACHKSKGDNVEFATIFNHYDIIYKSKVFTFTQDDLTYYNSDKIILGGSGYKKYNRLDNKIEHICPDYSLYNCQHAYGFLTRGCVRKCSFCIVPEKEGKLREHADIEEFLQDKKSAILLDNNVLASEYGLQQIEKIVKLKIKVDFNQGLDCRIISKNKNIAKLLSKVKWLKPIRMAFDSLSEMDCLINSVELLRNSGAKPKRYFIYILVKDDIKSAIKRVELCKKYDLTPFVQPYMDPKKENITISKKIHKFCLWVNRPALFKSVKFEQFLITGRSKKNIYNKENYNLF